MDNLCNIYEAEIENEDPSLATTAVHLLWDELKLARSSFVTITLTWRCPSDITSLEEHHAFFD